VPPELPEWFVEKVKAVDAKRAKIVIDHILKHGQVTTEELKTLYGYEHPPRAARDVREKGIPLETFRTIDAQGKSIAAYRFADPSKIRSGKLSGRKVFSKEFKELLIERLGSRCSVCSTPFEARYLQIDHRVPFVVGGEGGGENEPDEFQLLCGSCNRVKSWSCEHCANGTGEKQVKICRKCYWSNPEIYVHVALRPIRRLEVTWTNDEIREYEQLSQKAKRAKTPLPEFVKAALRKLGL